MCMYICPPCFGKLSQSNRRYIANIPLDPYLSSVIFYIMVFLSDIRVEFRLVHGLRVDITTEAQKPNPSSVLPRSLPCLHPYLCFR